MNDFKLDSRPNIKSGFKAPDGYFESLTDRVMLNLPMQEVKVIPLYRRRPVWVTSAAAALVLSMSLMLSKNETAAPAMPDHATSKDYILANVSQDELEDNVDLEGLKAAVNESFTATNAEVLEYGDQSSVYYDAIN